MSGNIKQCTRSQEGSLLLMSILILSGMITAASSFGVISLSNLKQSILTDNGARAFYAAESGVEDALYELRKNETAVASLASSGSLSNGGTWTRTVSTTIQSITRDIKKNDFFEVDLYDPDASLSSLGAPARSLKLAWSGSGSEWVEVQVASWTTSGTLGTPSTQTFSATSNPATVNLPDASTALYRVRIKALYGDITGMALSAYSGLNLGGSPVSIPAYLTVYATGAHSRANQVVRAQMPHRPPLSGQFGYVLFSEQDLIK